MNTWTSLLVVALLPTLCARAAGQEAMPPPGANIPVVDSPRIRIEYGVEPGGAAVTGVELWHTSDSGWSWNLAHKVETPAGPMYFDARTDGLHGFYLVLRSRAGSTPAPARGTVPHRWVRVDRGPPVVQVLEVSPDERFDLNREVLIRWRVEDDALPDRPTAIHYRSPGQTRFTPVAETLAGVGSYSWTVPQDVDGRITIKVSARDQAGNRGEDVADWLEISGSQARCVRSAQDAQSPPEPLVASKPAAAWAAPLEGIHNEPDAGWNVPDDRTLLETRRLYDQGTWHRLRGERGVAKARYREALRLHPGFSAARIDLAGLLVIENELEAAKKQYRRVLNEEPKHRSALRGLALVQARQRSYASAHESLQKLLTLFPDDAEGWLHFGDVCMFMGDRPAAREAWSTAAAAGDCPESIRSRAQKRLEIYRGDAPAVSAAAAP